MAAIFDVGTKRGPMIDRMLGVLETGMRRWKFLLDISSCAGGWRTRLRRRRHIHDFRDDFATTASVITNTTQTFTSFVTEPPTRPHMDVTVDGRDHSGCGPSIRMESTQRKNGPYVTTNGIR